MATSMKNKNDTCRQVPKFTKKELSRLENSKPSDNLLKALEYLKKVDNESLTNKCKAV